MVGCTRSDRKVTRLAVKVHILSPNIIGVGHLESPLLLTSYQHPSACAMFGNNVGINFLKAFIAVDIFIAFNFC
jgi:hypothetical protein